jgi:hypothetical protein
LGALFLALSFQTQRAHAYPAGSAVSAASNPVVSIGGHLDGSTTIDLFEAPPDQVLIITDVSLSLANTGSNCTGAMGVELTAGSVTIAGYGLGYPREGVSYSKSLPLVIQSFRSGLPVAPGQTLTLSTNQLWEAYCSGSNLRVYYTISGYYAHP